MTSPSTKYDVPKSAGNGVSSGLPPRALLAQRPILGHQLSEPKAARPEPTFVAVDRHKDAIPNNRRAEPSGVCSRRDERRGAGRRTDHDKAKVSFKSNTCILLRRGIQHETLASTAGCRGIHDRERGGGQRHGDGIRRGGREQCGRVRDARLTTGNEIVTHGDERGETVECIRLSERIGPGHLRPERRPTGTLQRGQAAPDGRVCGQPGKSGALWTGARIDRSCPRPDILAKTVVGVCDSVVRTRRRRA